MARLISSVVVNRVSVAGAPKKTPHRAPGRKRRASLQGRSVLESALWMQFELAGLAGRCVREFKFAAPQRQWRFDFAFLHKSVAVEVEGGVFTRGRHNRGVGMLADMDKYNHATELGWRVLRYGERQIKSGAALSQIERVLRQSAR